MRLDSLGNFGSVGQHELPDGVVAVAIAPSSEVDLVEVDGRRLGPGAIVRAGGTVTAVRGFRAGDELALALHLLYYEAGDPLVAPGPRAPVFRSGQATMGVGVANAKRVLRLPYSGRRRAVFAAKRADGDLNDAAFIVRGVRYLSRERIREDPSQQPYMTELPQVTLFDIFGVIPTSNLGGTVRYLGAQWTVGDGVMEGCDELELWAFDAGAGGVVYCTAEAFGERSAL